MSAYSAAYDRGLAFGEVHPGRIDTEINTALDNRDLAVSHDDWTGYVAGLAAAKVRSGEDG